MALQNLPTYLGATSSGLLRSEYRRAIDWLGQRCRGDLIVDIACGVGLIPLLLAREGMRTLGLDTDPHQVDQALIARDQQPEYVAALADFRVRGSDLGAVDAGAAGTVVVGSALTGLSRPGLLIEECDRILQPDGRLIVTFDPTSAHPTLRELKQLLANWRLVDSHVGRLATRGIGPTVLVLERARARTADSDWVDLASQILVRSEGVSSRSEAAWTDDLAPIMVFVISTGRAGSQSIAHEYGLLHEPDGSNPSLDGAAERSRGRFLYGETSHFWKNQLPSLARAFPHASLVHLVRDGRNVVKSFQSRGHYEGSDGQLPYRNEWLPPHRTGMSSFERICWYWTYWNEEIGYHTERMVRLEDLSIGAKTNVGSKKEAWTAEEEATFAEVCGDLMRRYGYW